MKRWKRGTVLIGMFVVMSISALSVWKPVYAERDLLMEDAEVVETTEGITISNEKISTENNKDVKYNNPISSDFYCADPTSVEYNGRLYLFGTNDHEQYEVVGPNKDNTYDKIKSFVILSTDDMVNWIYHGEINVGEVAPWIVNSWAPSIVAREEEDGLTHFYLYFSNNGLGVGVITATDPLGPWEDPLGEPLISSSTPGLTNCPNPFDPGAVIDENGDGWLSFGGGKASGGTDYMPGSARIVKLGDDMLSFESDFVEIPAPYFFEASELNYINGTYVYTYCSDWNEHSFQWDYACEVPGACSMVYMITKTPLDSDSWEMKGEYLKNPGLAGLDYCNNHTHLQKWGNEYYIFYHTLELKKGMGISGSYRSLAIEKVNVDEQTVTIERIGATREGVGSTAEVNPFTVNYASELNNTANISYDTTDARVPVVISNGEGSWISVKDVEFTESTEKEMKREDLVFDLVNIDKIQYNLTVIEVDKETEIAMYPSGKDGFYAGTVDVTGTGCYTITCDLGGTEGVMNIGYFEASNDAQIIFKVDTIVINDKYEFYISSELTNTREWANGLKNIWNGFSDGDKVYISDYAEFRYSKDGDLIKFYASADMTSLDSNSSAPLVEEPMTFGANVKGSGRVEVRIDNSDGALLTSIDFDTEDAYKTIFSNDVAEIGGTHDLYFVFSDDTISMKSWEFSTSVPDVIKSEDLEENEDAIDSDLKVNGEGDKEEGGNSFNIIVVALAVVVMLGGAVIIIKKNLYV